jgi:hypothetical protein
MHDRVDGAHRVSKRGRVGEVAEGDLHAHEANTGNGVWEAKLPAGANTGVAVSGNTLLVPAGVPQGQGQQAALVAYRLP